MSKSYPIHQAFSCSLRRAPISAERVTHDLVWFTWDHAPLTMTRRNPCRNFFSATVQKRFFNILTILAHNDFSHQQSLPVFNGSFSQSTLLYPKNEQQDHHPGEGCTDSPVAVTRCVISHDASFISCTFENARVRSFNSRSLQQQVRIFGF